MDNNSNHSYYEITTVSGRKSNGTSKTIYHDYSNIDKRLIFNNSTKNMNNMQTKLKLNDIYLNRNYSVNNMKKTTPNGAKRIILDNNFFKGSISRDKNNKIKIKILNENKNAKNFDIYDDINCKRSNKNGITALNTNHLFKKSDFIKYNKNVKSSNSKSSRNNQLYDISFRKYTNDGPNNYIYQSNNSNDIINKINPLLKNNFTSHNNYTFNNENRKQNIFK
jgi:hypothetical protein